MTKAELQALLDASTCLQACTNPTLLDSIQVQLLAQLAGVTSSSAAAIASANPFAPVAVDPNVYAPNFTLGAQVNPAIDYVTGGLLVLDRVKDASVDSILAVPPEPTPDAFIQISNVAGDGTNYVFGAPAIDLADYSYLSIVPEVTVAGTVATTVYWKFQWSFDGTNWFDDFLIDAAYGALGTPGAGERLQPTNMGSIVRSFLVATGYKGTTGAATGGAVAMNIPKQARFVRIGQKMNAAVTGTETVRYHHQLY